LIIVLLALGLAVLLSDLIFGIKNKVGLKKESKKSLKAGRRKIEVKVS